MRFHGLAAVVGISAALLVAGCGSDSSDGGGYDPTLTTADQNQLVRVVDQIQAAFREKDPVALCETIRPSAIDKSFGSKKRCAKVLGQGIKSSGVKELKIDSMKATETGATLTFKTENVSDIDLVKENGTWYVDLPDKAPAGSSGSSSQR